jgi:hypothetical protein
MSVKALVKPGVTTLAVMTKTTLVTAALAGPEPARLSSA